MTSSLCKRSWEIDALEDGRLLDKERASFERHVASCQECAHGIERRRELRNVLVDLPTPAPTELDRRRARAELLARANEPVAGRMRPPRWAIFALAPAFIALALVFFLALKGRHSRLPASAPVAATPTPIAPLFEIADVGHADFSTERADATSRVVLHSGSASFHVEHVKPGARFLVALPDGEVEVRGTRFVIDVAAGRTRSVVVSEGVVAVRIAGFDGVLRAGERWPRSDAAVISDPPQASAAISVGLPAAASSASPPLSARPSSSNAAAQASTQPLPGPRFAEAMGAFNAGDYGEADRLFVAYVREFPSDSRAEDAMFLLADARARRGDTAGAKEAARAYLRRFPTGLRAPSAARLAGDAVEASPR